MRTSTCKGTLSLLFIASSIIAFAQSPYIDSIKKVLESEKEDTNKVYTLNALFFAHQSGKYMDFSVALQYANDVLSLSEKLNYEKGKDFGYSDLGYAYGMRQDYAATLKYYFMALRIDEKIGNKIWMATSYQMIGGTYKDIGDNVNALKYLQMCLALREEFKDSDGIAQTLNTIAGFDDNGADYDEGIKTHFAALEIFEALGTRASNWGVPYCYGAIGNAYRSKAFNFYNQHEPEKFAENIQQAVKYYRLALKGYKEIYMIDGVGIMYINIGAIYISLGQNAKARRCFQEGIKFSLESNQKSYLMSGYLYLSILDSTEHHYKSALNEYKKSILLGDSLHSEESTQQVLQSQMEYRFEKKQDSIQSVEDRNKAIARAEQDKKDAEAKRIKNNQYFIIAGLGIIILSVLIIALIQYRNNQHKKKANTILEKTLGDLKSTQTQLIQSEKMASLGELTAGIAHEIQNPLNFVNNFSDVNAELIEEAGEEIDRGNFNDAKEILNDIKENEQKINHHGKRADAIIKGMLQHSRSSTGVNEKTDINALANEYLGLSYHGLRAKDKSFNATLKTDFDNTIGKINIIPQEIGRVLLNLYNNAFYAVNEKMKTTRENYQPTVSIQTKKTSDKVVLTVMDNGNGVPKKVIDKIFQPFFTTKPTGQGTGLGLSLSYDIIKAHGGEIKVETKEGYFTEFAIHLPISS